jgi:hypothetical protein
MIFAREVSDPLTSLVKKLDKATADNAKARMGSFVVFCNDDEKLEKNLQEVAKKEKISRCILSIFEGKAGPYNNFEKDADVTVMLYVKNKVVANHTFKKGEMKDKDVDKIIDDLPKILPK